MTKLTQSYYCGASQSQIIYETIGNYFDGTRAANPEVEARWCAIRTCVGRISNLEQVNSLVRTVGAGRSSGGSWGYGALTAPSG